MPTLHTEVSRTKRLKLKRREFKVRMWYQVK